MLYPDHHTRRLLVSEHQGELRRLAEQASTPAARRFTMTALAGAQLVESRRRRLAWRRRVVRAVSPLAALAAVALAATAFAVPAAVACPLDPNDNCLVCSPDTRDLGPAKAVAPKAKAKPGKQQAKPPRALPRPLLPHRGGV